MKAPQSFLALVGLVAFALPVRRLKPPVPGSQAWGTMRTHAAAQRPARRLPGLFSKTAASGEIDALDPGGFGALTITKSITLDGGGGQVHPY